MTNDELVQELERLRLSLERHLLIRSRFTLSREDMQDIVQDVLLRYIKNREEKPEKLLVTAWHARVAENLLKDHWRRSANRKTVSVEDVVLVDTKSLSEKDHLLRKAFLDAFRDLTETEQTLLYLVSAGATHSEIAKAYREPQTSIAYWVKVAKDKLRQHPKLSGIFDEDRR
jgi:RNA polymerase sigma factor (sigma-70 family)